MITARGDITNSLFKESIGGYPYMMPDYSFCTYYFSNLFGWFFEIILNTLLIKFLCLIDLLKRKYNDAIFYYAVTYIEIELGMCFFVENIYLFFHVISGMVIWIIIFFYLNRIGKKNKKYTCLQ